KSARNRTRFWFSLVQIQGFLVQRTLVQRLVQPPKITCQINHLACAGGGIRTLTPLRATDFESVMSAVPSLRRYVPPRTCLRRTASALEIPRRVHWLRSLGEPGGPAQANLR